MERWKNIQRKILSFLVNRRIEVKVLGFCRIKREDVSLIMEHPPFLWIFSLLLRRFIFIKKERQEKRYIIIRNGID